LDTIPEIRRRQINAQNVRPDGEYVLYWMIAARRTRFNYALQHAIHLAQELGRPLIVLEALRAGYPWASVRLHTFVTQGMADNHQALKSTPVAYYPYIEPEPGAGSGLLQALAAKACAVVTDDFPCFFLPRMVEAAGRKLEVRLEAIDSNGLLPLHENDREFTRAHSFRIHMHKCVVGHLQDSPAPAPLKSAKLPKASIPAAVAKRWPLADLSGTPVFPASLVDIPAAPDRGGPAAATKRLRAFMDGKLSRYAEDRNHPDEDAASGLSPWLHFGHLSAHEVFQAVAEKEEWDPDKVDASQRGKREGWWGMGANAESFLDELITWREVGYHHCRARPNDYDRFDSLPQFAIKTLAEHSADRREYQYTLEQFRQAETHDEIWNAAQRQLLAEGRIHNYLRMLWGKKILHWTKSPQQALEFMIELNNCYALDGRNPNSYSGIFWCLGRFDRAWGPERPVFGKVRYMTSDNTRRKLRMEEYLQRYGG
jgi:deoxyribodipyrimidine photo-lyase